MFRHITTLEVRGPRLASINLLISMNRVTRISPGGASQGAWTFHFDRGQVVASWIEARQTMLITVHEEDPRLPVAAGLFSQLALVTRAFEIRHDLADETCYEFAWLGPLAEAS